MKVLVINSGSSSIKYQLFEMPEGKVICSGLLERIGSDNAVLSYKYLRGEEFLEYKVEHRISNHSEGLEEVAKLLTDKDMGVINNPDDIDVVGHRVVHGGEKFAQTTLIDDGVMEQVKSLFSLAPLHNPPNYLGIQVAEKIFKHAKQIAVFDTAFHQTIPAVAYRFPIPNELYTEHGVRAYGFHGTSHKYVSEQAIQYYNNPALKIISIHMGNGCSMSAIKDGICLDTSMGLGPMNGLVMGTRAGDVDQSVIFYLINQLGYSSDHVNDLLNKKSGLLGLAGVSDMRDLKQLCEKGDKNALLAHDIYVYKIKKYIGSYAAVLNGLDVVIFTAGVGENDAYTRGKICEHLEFFGIELDTTKNTGSARGLREINKENARVKILVIPTNEEKEIADQCYKLLS